MAKSSSRLVVKPHQPWKRWILQPLLAAAVIGSCWGFYRYGRMSAEHDFFTLQAQQADMHAQLRQLGGENDTLRERNTVLERERQIEGQAFDEMKRSTRLLQEELLELKEEVAFYRSIVIPSESARGLRIQTFHLDHEGQKRVYRYTLVLTHVAKGQRVAEGRIAMTVEGFHHGERKTLSLSDLSDGQDDTLSFRFRYFQNFEGDIVLPEGFSAQRVRIKVSAEGVRIEKTFDWPEHGQSEGLSYLG